MSVISIEYVGDLKTRAYHSLSEENIKTDAPPDNNGKGEFFSPSDMFVTSLGSCMLTIMGIAANTNSIYFETAKLRVEKKMSSNPRMISEINITINLMKDLSKKDRLILERAAKSCPVSRSIHPNIKKNIIFNYSI